MNAWVSSTSIIHRLTQSLCLSLLWVCLSALCVFQSMTWAFAVLHLYYKLDYIALSWCGADEQERDHANRNSHTINWQDQALTVVEEMVHVTSLLGSFTHKTMCWWRCTTKSDELNLLTHWSPPHLMQVRGCCHPNISITAKPFWRQKMVKDSLWSWDITWRIGQQMWQRVLILSNGGRQVNFDHYISSCLKLVVLQDHAVLYPTLTQIALNVLPCHASSVPCERLFSASKQATDLHQLSLGAKCFEELQHQENLILLFCAFLCFLVLFCKKVKKVKKRHPLYFFFSFCNCSKKYFTFSK